MKITVATKFQVIEKMKEKKEKSNVANIYADLHFIKISPQVWVVEHYTDERWKAVRDYSLKLFIWL